MAAGRHGGYRDYSRRERELDQEVSRRKEYHISRHRDLDRDNSTHSTRRNDIRDNKGRDLRNREISNGYNHSNQSNHRYPQMKRSADPDREPGELSSGSGSEDSNLRRENRESQEIIPSPSKKRKFSPIVWDREDTKQQNSNSVSCSSKIDPSVSEEAALDSPRDLHMNGDAELEPESEQIEMEQEEEEAEEEYYYTTTKNISSSRWADNEELERERESNKKAPTPELGEVVITRENSGVSRSRSRSRSSSSGSEREDDDYMEVDGVEREREIHLAGSDSELEDSIKDELTVPVVLPQRFINMLQGCRSVDEFERLNKINEGTYGVVYRARDKKCGEIVALKKVKMEKEREGFPLTSLREINILLSFHHPAIVDVKEVVVGSSLDSIFMVMEYMEHDLKGVMETMKQPYSQSEVKCLMIQLLEGVKYLHDNWVLHRDLKTSNILLNNRGELKICDFGLSRQYGSPLKQYTQLVVTLWYRAPELLLGAKEYSTAIDMWSLGCIMAELLSKEPLFSGKTEVDQLDRIFKRLGTPNEKIWPGFTKLPGVKVNFVKQPYNTLREMFPATSFSGGPTLSEAGFDLLNKLLTYDPEKRITADEALRHPWFREVPLPKSKDFMPTFPAHNEQDRKLRRVMKSPDPLEAQRLKESRGIFG